MQKKEKYYENHEDLFTELEKEIAHNLDQDLSIFKSEITDLLEDEIINRYFYDEGAISWTIKKDEQVLKAIEILNNKEIYESVLRGKSGSTLVTKMSEPENGKSYNSETRENQEPI